MPRHPPEAEDSLLIEIVEGREACPIQTQREVNIESFSLFVLPIFLFRISDFFISCFSFFGFRAFLFRVSDFLLLISLSGLS